MICGYLMLDSDSNRRFNTYRKPSRDSSTSVSPDFIEDTTESKLKHQPPGMPHRMATL